MIELLCLISNEKEDKIIKPLYNKYDMPFNITTYGEGTASSSVLEYFGLEEVKKYVYFSLINRKHKKEVLEDIKTNLPSGIDDISLAVSTNNTLLKSTSSSK